MIDVNDGFYSRTQAFNFIKSLLGVNTKVLIRKEFFYLTFQEAEPGFYSTRKPENVIKKIFAEKGIMELNSLFYENKQAEKHDDAKHIFEIAYTSVKESMAA